MQLTLHTQLLKSIPLEEALKLAGASGFEAVCIGEEHLTSGTSVSGDEIAGWAQEYEIEVAALDAGTGKFMEAGDSNQAFEKASGAVELALATGCPRVLLHPSRRPVRPTDLFEHVKQESLWIQKLLDAFEAPPQVLLYITPMTLAHDPFSAIGMLQWVDRLDARLVYDPALLYQNRMEVSAEALSRVEDRLGILMLRDFRLDEGKAVDTPFMQGIQQFDPLVRQLLRAHFDGCLIMGSHFTPGEGISLEEVLERERRLAEKMLAEAAE